MNNDKIEVPRLRIEDAERIIRIAGYYGLASELRELLAKANVHGDSHRPQHQGEPVVVVLPEHKPAEWRGMSATFAKAWNACLDEVTRLNTK